MKKTIPPSHSHAADFFDQHAAANTADVPLAVRMRPKAISEYIGQQHILGEGKLLRRAIDADRVSSLILYGPAGCGKTTLAHIVANKTKAYFEMINAVCSGVEELRGTIEKAKFRKTHQENRTIIFIDEIHRFNKAQQDVLMPGLEEGSFTLIGATVHNPYFYLTAPLLSRSLVFELKPLTASDIKQIVHRALSDPESGLAATNVSLKDEALDFLARSCEGDARRALNALEIGVLTTPKDENGVISFTSAVAQESIQKKAVRYDRGEDEHYDTASAFIKSMRGSDPDAAIYWMAKMLEAGEDPRFIARRICICAAEDVGNADPMALVLAQSAFGAIDFIGMPEARIPLAQAAIYVACAPKSNASYLAIEKAQEAIRTCATQEVPEHLKDASYRGAQKLGRGKGYKYAHDFPGHIVEQAYMQEQKTFYEPTDRGYEKKIKERLRSFRHQHNEGTNNDCDKTKNI